MLPLLLVLLAEHAEPVAPAPRITSLTVASSAQGLCAQGTSAALRVSWTIANPDAAFRATLYENGRPVGTFDAADGSWDKVIQGSVEDGAFSRWTSAWLYHLEVRRIRDGLLVDTRRIAEPWTQQYGTCEPSLGTTGTSGGGGGSRPSMSEAT